MGINKKTGHFPPPLSDSQRNTSDLHVKMRLLILPLSFTLFMYRKFSNALLIISKVLFSYAASLGIRFSIERWIKILLLVLTDCAKMS